MSVVPLRVRPKARLAHVCASALGALELASSHEVGHKFRGELPTCTLRPVCAYRLVRGDKQFKGHRRDERMRGRAELVVSSPFAYHAACRVAASFLNGHLVTLHLHLQPVSVQVLDEGRVSSGPVEVETTDCVDPVVQAKLESE